MSTPNPFGANTQFVPGIKISALGEATLPLSGDEEIPGVQDGITRRIAVADIAGSASGAISFTGVRAVAVSVGNTNDWAPDIADVSRLEITPGGVATVTGLVGGTDGRVLILTNLGADPLTLFVEDLNSAAANRFAANGDILLNQGFSAMLLYSAALQRWTRIG